MSYKDIISDWLSRYLLEEGPQYCDVDYAKMRQQKWLAEEVYR